MSSVFPIDPLPSLYPIIFLSHLFRHLVVAKLLQKMVEKEALKADSAVTRTAINEYVMKREQKSAKLIDVPRLSDHRRFPDHTGLTMSLVSTLLKSKISKATSSFG